MKTLTNRAVIAFAIGAVIGLIGWLDQQIIGEDYYASIQDILPVRGFWWNVLGAGCTLVIFYLVGVLIGQLGDAWHGFRIDKNHAYNCMHRERRFQSRYQCTCKRTAVPRMRVIQGGRND